MENVMMPASIFNVPSIRAPFFQGLGPIKSPNAAKWVQGIDPATSEYF